MNLIVRMTPAVRVLVIVTGAGYLVQVLADRVAPFTLWFGLVPAQVAHGWVWQLATYAFLHGGLLHLLFNLWALAVLGPPVEERLGTAAFARFYAWCGIGAGACALALAWGSADVVIGASGAIFGVILAFARLYPRMPLTMFLFLVLPVTMEARLFAIVLGAVNVLMLASSGGRGLGQIAHLGGLLLGWLWFRLPPLSAWGAAWRGWRGRRRSDRIARAYASLGAERAALQEEVDGLLDKISRTGMAGLSEREKLRLVEASERLKRL